MAADAAADALASVAQLPQPVDVPLLRKVIRRRIADVLQAHRRQRLADDTLTALQLAREYVALLATPSVEVEAEVREAIDLLPERIVRIGVQRINGLPTDAADRQALAKWRKTQQGLMCAWLAGFGPEPRPHDHSHETANEVRQSGIETTPAAGAAEETQPKPTQQRQQQTNRPDQTRAFEKWRKLQAYFAAPQVAPDND